MEFSDQELRQIVAQASTLEQRLQGEFIPDDKALEAEDVTDGQRGTQVDERLQRWQKTINGPLFEKRLAWDGFHLESVREVLGNVCLPDTADLPDWAFTLNALLASVPQDVPTYRFISDTDPVAFESIVAPFVQLGSTRIAGAAGWELLSTSAQIDLERDLLKMLSWRMMRAFDAEFKQYRLQENPLWLIQSTIMPATASTALYSRYCADLRDGGLCAFFKRYAALAYLASRTFDLWVSKTIEFLGRLQNDWMVIQDTFFASGTKPEKVTAFQIGLSDLHEGNRTVMRLTFDGGQSLIYKPKSLEVEVFYNALIEWINARCSLSLDLRAFQIVPRSHFGWVEFMTHDPCQDEAAIGRFYHRAGMLLSLVSVLNGCDIHSENIIAHGEHPVIVDLETILYPQILDLYKVDAKNSTPISAQDSLGTRHDNLEALLKTGLLPEWQMDSQGRVSDSSGFSRYEHGINMQLVWKHLNTDDMVLKFDEVPAAKRANAPFLSGVATDEISLADYLPHILDGYQEMYHALLNHRDALLDIDSEQSLSVLTLLRRTPIRFVFRATRVYGLIREKSLHPEYLRCGVDRSILFEQLNYAFLFSDEKPVLWPLARVEAASLVQLDIPFFTTEVDSAHLFYRLPFMTPRHSIPDVLKETARQRLIANLQSLTTTALTQQTRVINNVFSAYLAHDPEVTILTKYEDEVQVQNSGSILPTESDELRKILQDEAYQIADKVVGETFYTEHGVEWLSFLFARDSGRYQYCAVTNDLYEGTVGILLFLAAVERVGNAGLRHLIRDGAAPLFSVLQDVYSRQQLARNIEEGGLSGMGSLIYALVKISQLLDDEQYLQQASFAALALDSHSINATLAGDIYGAAGSVLSLLALYEATGLDQHLVQAVAYGNHVLAQREVSPNGHNVWGTNGNFLTGYAHGASGVAYALTRLYKYTQITDFMSAAHEALDYLQATYSPEAKSWPDYRVKEQTTYSVSWCNGAPGIGLGYLGMSPVLDMTPFQPYLDAALHVAEHHRWQKIDHVCCGRTGRLETLLVASQQKHDLALQDTVYRKAAQIISQAKQNQGYQLFGNLPPGTGDNFGFFQGLTGVGYQWLRIASPEVLPSILLFE